MRFHRSKKLKKNTRLGFTLSEMLTALIIAALAIAVIAGGVPVALKAKKEIAEKNQVNMLMSILTEKITDELRFAGDFDREPKDGYVRGQIYQSAVYGDITELVNNTSEENGNYKGIYVRVYDENGNTLHYFPVISKDEYPENVYALVTSPEGSGSYYYEQATKAYRLMISIYKSTDGAGDKLLMSQEISARPLRSR